MYRQISAKKLGGRALLRESMADNTIRELARLNSLKVPPAFMLPPTVDATEVVPESNAQCSVRKYTERKPRSKRDAVDPGATAGGATAGGAAAAGSGGGDGKEGGVQAAQGSAAETVVPHGKAHKQHKAAAAARALERRAATMGGGAAGPAGADMPAGAEVAPGVPMPPGAALPGAGGAGRGRKRAAGGGAARAAPAAKKKRRRNGSDSDGTESLESGESDAHDDDDEWEQWKGSDIDGAGMLRDRPHGLPRHMLVPDGHEDRHAAEYAWPMAHGEAAGLEYAWPHVAGGFDGIEARAGDGMAGYGWLEEDNVNPLPEIRPGAAEAAAQAFGDA